LRVAYAPGGSKAKAVHGMPDIRRVLHRENFLPNLFMDKYVAT
jgi:hypothetical protein